MGNGMNINWEETLTYLHGQNTTDEFYTLFNIDIAFQPFKNVPFYCVNMFFKNLKFKIVFVTLKLSFCLFQIMKNGKQNTRKHKKKYSTRANDDKIKLK